jgi:hypothetical protein
MREPHTRHLGAERRRPRWLLCDPFAHLDADLARGLVLPQADEGRMAHVPVARPLGERHLSDEPRLDPVEPASTRRRRDGRRRTPKLLEPLAQRDERLAVEARAHLAGVAERAAGIVGREHERAESAARAGRVGEARDHELLAARALDLEPRASTTGAVGRVGALADDALDAAPAGLGEHGGPLPLDVIAEAQRRVGGQRSEQASQQRLPLQQRAGAHVPAVEEEERSSRCQRA